MKKIVVLFTIIVGISSMSHGQRLKQDEVDEFTGNLVKRTSWSTLSLNWDLKSFTSYFRISRINENKYLDLKIQTGYHCSINKGQEIMFKMKSGEIVKLPSLEYAISCMGCGAKGIGGSEAPGIQVDYPLGEVDIKIFQNGEVEKIRVYTTDGYIESDMNPTYYEKFRTALSLVE